MTVLKDFVLLEAPLKKCCHGNSKGSTLKLLPFKKVPRYFQEIHQIWLNYLSPSPSYGQKRQGWCRTPPEQDRVNTDYM